MRLKMLLPTLIVIAVASVPLLPRSGSTYWNRGWQQGAERGSDSRTEYVDLRFYADTADKRALHGVARVAYEGSRQCISIIYVDAVKVVAKRHDFSTLMEMQKASPATLLTLIGEEFYARLASSLLCKGTYTASILPLPRLLPVSPWPTSVTVLR